MQVRVQPSCLLRAEMTRQNMELQRRLNSLESQCLELRHLLLEWAGRVHAYSSRRAEILSMPTGGRELADSSPAWCTRH